MIRHPGKETEYFNGGRAYMQGLQLHDVNVVLNATGPGYLPIMMKQVMEQFRMDKNAQDKVDIAAIQVRATFRSMLAASDTYSDFSAWWSKAFGNVDSVPTDVYEKEITRLLNTGEKKPIIEGPMADYKYDAEQTYNEVAIGGVTHFTDTDSDNITTRVEVENFVHSLDKIGCQMAQPLGGILPKRVCASEGEGSVEGVDPHKLWLSKWLSGAQ